MKSINLSSEHQEKLLEMTNKLFPKYRITESYPIRDILLCDQSGNCHHHSSEERKIFVYTATIYGFAISITHWYEFCLNHLSKELFHQLIKSNLRRKKIKSCDLDDLVDYEQELRRQFLDIILIDKHSHIIDYLYEEFKKIK